jgi:hypothetical protein
MIPLFFLLSASAFAQSGPVSYLYRDCTTVRAEESGMIALARIRAGNALLSEFTDIRAC